MVEYAKNKIQNKNLDFIVANNIAQSGAGFKGDTNIATIIKSNGEIIEYPQMTKNELGDIILDQVKTYLSEVE